MAEDDPDMRAWVRRVLTGHEVGHQKANDLDPYMRMWIQEVLSRHEISVHEATSGVDLLFLLTIMPEVDLVISDMRMPLLDGLEALAMARRAGMGVPFLLITAFGDCDLRHCAGQLDAWVLDKPFSAPQLLTCVAAVASALERGPARSNGSL